MHEGKPSVATVEWPVAKKEHVCAECQGTIYKGVKHQLVTGKWGGKWSRPRSHEECARLRRKLGLLYDCIIPIGYAYGLVDEKGLDVEDGELLVTRGYRRERA